VRPKILWAGSPGGGSMDLNTNAFRIVKSLTEGNKEVSKYTVAGSLGGKLGGPARSRRLTPARRQEIARLASRARWKKSV